MALFSCFRDTSLALWPSYHLSLLTARDRALEQLAAQTPPGGIDPAIAGLLERTPGDGWEPLFEAEQRLLRYASLAEVEAEFARRSVEGERLGVVSVVALKEAFAQPDASEVLKRHLYRCLIEDLQFRYAKRRLDRLTRSRIVWHYILSGVALLVVFALFLWWTLSITKDADRMLYNIVFVMLIGLGGAYFSRLTAFNSGTDLDYDALMATYRFRSLVLRGGIGMLAAMVMYYLIYSGLIAGDLFPAREGIKSITSMFSGGEPLIPAKDTAKLMVWCFLAGFSERLVTGTLERLENADEVKRVGGGG